MSCARIVIAVGLGMMVAGCATDVDETVPREPAPEEQRDPPERSLSTPYRDPQALLIAGMEISRGEENVGARQVPRLPDPAPESE